MAKSETASGGIGLSGLLLVAFIVLKLCHVIDWQWVWVLSPFWIPLGLFLAVLALFGAGLGIMALLAAVTKYPRARSRRAK